MKTVMVVGGDRDVEEMFKSREWTTTAGMGSEKLDLVCFTGGEDVSPELYGEVNEGLSYTNPSRDRAESLLFRLALMANIPMVGICRGGQFLNVMNGGKMIQHIDGHGWTNHRIHGFLEGGGSDILIEDALGDHHQGMIPRGQEKIEPFHTKDERVSVIGIADDNVPEIIWYPDTKSLCFQPHPEWGHKGTEDLFFNLIKEYIDV